MEYLLICIEGVLCDTRRRDPLFGKAAFYQPQRILADVPTPGSVAFLQELAANYGIVYIGSRPPLLQSITEEWLQRHDFPPGEVCLGRDISDRLALVRTLARTHCFAAGLGSGWLDSMLHTEIGCKSFILRHWEPDWDWVRTHL